MNSLAGEVGLAPVAGKKYKLFLVEVDDEDRERVLSARTGPVEITVEPQWGDVEVDYLLDSAMIFRNGGGPDIVTVKIQLVPSESGTYFTIEDFSDNPQEEDEDE